MLIATPIDLARVIKIDKPALRVTYEVEELTKPGLTDQLAACLRGASTLGLNQGAIGVPRL